MQIWTNIHKFLANDQVCAMISVIDIAGSTPREIGAAIIIDMNGKFYGSIGGGNLENDCIKTALLMMQESGGKIRREKHLLGPDMGQCCGGAVTTLIEIFEPKYLDDVVAFAAREKQGHFVVCAMINDQTLTREILDIEPEKLGIVSQDLIIEQ